MEDLLNGRLGPPIFPLWVFLCGAIKNIVYARTYNNQQELTQIVTNAIIDGLTIYIYL